MLRSLWLRIRKRRQLERDLQDELAHHFEMRASGARAPFGNATAIQEEIRDQWTFTHVENLWRDVRHAVRVLRRAPGHTTAIILLLALGIGSNAAIFTLFNAVFLRPLAVDRPQELAILARTVDGNPSGWSLAGFEDFQSRQTSFKGVFAIGGIWEPVSLDPAGEPLSAQQASQVSGNFFQVLGVRAVIGRLFVPADDQLESPNLVVLSNGFWRQYFGGDPAVVGRAVYVDRKPFRVIGVTPPEFVGLGQSVWVPLNFLAGDPNTKSLLRNTRAGWLTVMGRLRPDVSIQQAQAEAEVIHAQTPEDVPEKPSSTASVRIEPGSRGLGRIQKQFGESLQFLMGAVALLLLIACANVGSLLLARA
ncbi:MAG: ABC transporter permease [Bryobacteraceae bacterium]